MLLNYFLLMLVFLIGTFFLTASTSAFRRLHRRETKKQLSGSGKFFFYRPLHLYFFPEHEFEGLYFSTICALSVARFGFIAFAVLFFVQTPLFEAPSQEHIYDFSLLWMLLGGVSLIFLSFLLADYLPRKFGQHMPALAIRSGAPICSLFMLAAFPITYIFLKASRSLSHKLYFDHGHEPSAEIKQEFIDLIQQAEIDSDVPDHEKKLLESVIRFRERIAREIMVPRVNLFSLADDTTIREAALLLQKEGYSRTPIYHDTVDDIIGVLMYKDILSKYMEFADKPNNPEILDAPVTSIMKSPLYTPETKKISNLLQEVRKKQMHMAIVVDEYGGTEGLVTIEDILEEIVGDISDEYDEEERLFWKQPDGSWIVDARMTIPDFEEQFDIILTQEGDYDTLGGYVFHCAGAIPQKGFVIHQEAFELVIVESNERSVERIRLRLAPSESEDESEQEPL